MSYDTEGYGGLSGQRGGYIQDDRRSPRQDVEEEPSELDAPEGDGLEADELEDDEPISPLAEDRVDEEGEAAEVAASAAEPDDIEGDPEVHHSGGSASPLMHDDDRRREFPTAKEVARAAGAKKSMEPRVTKRRGRRKIARA